MKKVAAFCALPNRDRLLLVEAALALVFFGMALRLVTVERLRAWAGNLRPGTGPLERIVWAVRTSARRVPGATCLSSALALQRMLSRRGYALRNFTSVLRGRTRTLPHMRGWCARNGC